MAEIRYDALCQPLRVAMPRSTTPYDVKLIDFGAGNSYTTAVEAEQTFLATHVLLGHCEVWVDPEA